MTRQQHAYQMLQFYALRLDITSWHSNGRLVPVVTTGARMTPGAPHARWMGSYHVCLN